MEHPDIEWPDEYRITCDLVETMLNSLYGVDGYEKVHPMTFNQFHTDPLVYGTDFRIHCMSSTVLNTDIVMPVIRVHYCPEQPFARPVTLSFYHEFSLQLIFGYGQDYELDDIPAIYHDLEDILTDVERMKHISAFNISEEELEDFLYSLDQETDIPAPCELSAGSFVLMQSDVNPGELTNLWFWYNGFNMSFYEWQSRCSYNSIMNYNRYLLREIELYTTAR